MADRTLKFVLVKNNLPTAKEPYLGQFVSNGTTALDALCEKVCAGRTNIDAPTLKLILRTALAFVAEDMAENVFRYQTGLLTFEPAIEGSLPSMDAPLTDENPIVVAVRLAGEFVREIGAAVPSRDSDDAISVKIDDVLDLETEVRQQVTGRCRFQLTGRNISARGEGESLAVAGPDGVAHACPVVEEDGMGQRIVAEAPAGVTPGKGAVLLSTRGYATPDGETVQLKKQVTVLPDRGPKPLAVSQDGTVKIMSVDEIHADEPFMIGGVNLGFDGEANRGIMGALAMVNGVSLDWYCGGEEEGSANQSFAPSAPFPPELASGTYRAAVTFNLSGHGEDLEPLVVEGVKIVVP